MPTPILGAPTWTEGQALPATTGNEIIAWVEFFAAGGNVIDRDLDDPSALTPVAGEAYLLPGSGCVDDWLGEDGNIALFVNTAWVFITPKEGMRLWVADEDTDIRYDGADWVILTVSGVPIATMTASEDIAAAHFVNIHDSSGAKIRLADASDGTKPVHAYAPSGILNTASGQVYGPGTVISGLSGLTPGATYFLSTTSGEITVTAPSGAGELVQEIGTAISSTQLFFAPNRGIVL